VERVALPESNTGFHLAAIRSIVLYRGVKLRSLRASFSETPKQSLELSDSGLNCPSFIE
jgi:hypothetical protein